MNTHGHKDTEKKLRRRYHRLEGSELKPSAEARYIDLADPSETLRITICVRPRPGSPPLPDHAHWMATSPGKRKFLSVEEFGAKHGAAEEDLDAIARFAESHGLEVVDSSVPCRSVVLSGAVDQVNRAFAVELKRYEGPNGAYRGHEGPIGVPEELAGVVTAVFGLDNRRLGHHNNGGDPSGTTAFFSGPSNIAQLYNFPPVPANISKQTIAVMEFAGGWGQPDINTTFTNWGVSPAPIPVDVPVTGSNKYGANPPLDTEPMLDICVVGAIAPGAGIRVYWGSDEHSANDWISVANALIKDANVISVVTNSLVLANGDDSLLGSMLVPELSGKFQALGTMGVTVFSACGDDGARSLTTDGNVHVQYPGSDHWVTSCGGTTVSATPPNIEWVWNDTNPDGVTPQATGGGVSAFFTTLPDWQVGVVSQKMLKTNAVGRGVPDVAGNASINSGYSVVVDQVGGPSKPVTLCGTSAVAPLYAGLMAIVNATLGQNIGFLNPTLYAFRDTVCRDINDQIYPGSPQDNSAPAFIDSFSGTSFPAVTGYPSGPGWDACTGLGTIDGGALLAALQGVFKQDCQFIVDRTQIGKDEVSDTLSTATPGSIANAFYIVVDGFSAKDLGIHSSDLTGVPFAKPTFSSSVAGMNVQATSLLAEDTSLPPSPQRFTWVCEAVFKTDLSAFNTIPVGVTLKASIATVSGPGTVELVANADPYELDGAVSWLSTDLRVFQIAAGSSMASVILNNNGVPTTDAPNFIQQLIAAFNANSTPPPNHPFDSISTDEQVSQVTLDFNPASPIYNFGVARVRYRGTSHSSKVRVFFRLYQAATTSTAYEPDTYASVANVSASGKIPVFGVDASGDLVAIPCFATKRATPGTDLSKQTDDFNVVLNGIQPGAGGAVTYTYFGCWLDINQSDSANNAVPNPPVPANSSNPWSKGSQSVLAAVRGQHQCLIAEISYDADPISLGETPASSDKLAQRNLAIVSSSNPGNAASHSIPQTFDIRPTPAGLPTGAKVDELMIDWRNTPAGSTASIYLPAINATDVLTLAAKMYVTHRLSLVDDHTLLCQTGGATWIPVPKGGQGNFAGLLTVELPSYVRKGQAHTIVVRQMTNSTFSEGVRRDRRVGAGSNVKARPIAPSLSERRVLGTFQLTIPVKAAETLLVPEERLLAIMRWIDKGIPPCDKWSPVFKRYVSQIAGRVTGFGGDPTKIPRSPTGSIPEAATTTHLRGFKGKVTGLVYDSFGDFDGFVLITEHGREEHFRGREHRLEELLRRAWSERISITVIVDPHLHHWPASIILRC